MAFTLTYDKWKADNIVALQKMKGKNLLLLFTGGKDCSLILEFILQAQQEMDLRLRVVAGKYPNACFPKKETSKLFQYWLKRGVHIEFHEIDKSDARCESALKQKGNPCDVCHTVRLGYLKKLVEQYAEKESLVVIFGFTLWDLVSYSLEYILGHSYALSSSPSLFQGKYAKERFEKRTSKRFYSLRQTEMGCYFFNPLIHYNDPEIIMAIEGYKTKLIMSPCKYSCFRPKRMFFEAYKNMDMAFDYLKVNSFMRIMLKASC